MFYEITIAAGGAVVGWLIKSLFKTPFNWYFGKKQSLDEWYEDGISLVSHSKALCDSFRTREDLNYGDISDEARKMNNRIMEHINPYPDNADEEIVADLYELSEIFSRMAAATGASSDDTSKDSINELLEMSQREAEELDLDYTTALQQSTEYSPIMNQLFDETNLNPEQLGDFADSEIKNAENITELINTFLHTTQGMNISQERIIGEITDEDWDQNLSIGNRLLLQIARNKSKETINKLVEVTGKSTIIN